MMWHFSIHNMNIPLWVISGTACGIIIAFPPKANREMSRASRAAHAFVVHKTRLIGKYDNFVWEEDIRHTILTHFECPHTCHISELHCSFARDRRGFAVLSRSPFIARVQ